MQINEINWTDLSYIIKFAYVSVCVYVCVYVRNRFPNHAYNGDETYANYSIGLE